MANPTPENRPVRSRSKLLILGGVAALIAGAVYYRHHLQEEALREQEQRANEIFSPATEKLEQAAAEETAPALRFDLDKTIRVLHGIDQAIENCVDVKEYLTQVARQDYRGVPPEVLKSRTKILKLLLRLYAKQVEEADQKAFWDFSRELLSMMSVVKLGGEAGSAGLGLSLGIDRDKAQKVLADASSRQKERTLLLREIEALQGELLQALVDFSATYHKYVAEWDRLSTFRDRAYLAARVGDWPTVIDSANQAIEMAPMESAPPEGARAHRAAPRGHRRGALGRSVGVRSTSTGTRRARSGVSPLGRPARQGWADERGPARSAAGRDLLPEASRAARRDA